MKLTRKSFTYKSFITALSAISFSLASCSSAPNVPNNSNVTTNPNVTTNISKSISLPEGYTGQMIDDLEDGDRFNNFRGTWFIYDDRYSDGDSQTIPEAYSAFVADSGGPLSSTKYAHIRGKVTTTIPDGYAGMGMDLNPNNNQARDLSQYDAIEFWSKGDGKIYRFKIHSEATSDYDDFGYNFQTSSQWQRHLIPLSSLTQEGYGKPASLENALATALKMQWQTVGQPHESIDLAIDNIRLLKSK